jgi:cytochrome P450
MFLRNVLKERIVISPEKHRGDFLDQAISDMDKEKFLSEDFVVYVLFGFLFAAFESISAVLSLTLKFLADHPSVVQELMVFNLDLQISFNVIPLLYMIRGGHAGGIYRYAHIRYMHISAVRTCGCRCS